MDRNVSVSLYFFLSLVVLNIYASQEPDQWAHFLRAGASHARKPSIEDKQYYASLIMDSNKLLQDLAKIFFNVDLLSAQPHNVRHDDLYQLLTLCNEAKAVLAQLSKTRNELERYNARVHEDTITHQCAVIAQSSQSYQSRLDILDAGTLKGLREIELKDVKEQAPQKQSTSVQVPLCIVDEMKAVHKDNKRPRTHHGAMHTRNLSRTALQINTQGSSLGCAAKACIVGTTAAVVAGIMVIILAANGYFGQLS